jgi:3-oxoacyl-[acyl-carrier protein] reductase
MAALEYYTAPAPFELDPWSISASIVHPPVTDGGWVTNEGASTSNKALTCFPLSGRMRSPKLLRSSHLYARLITANTVHLR